MERVGLLLLAAAWAGTAAEPVQEGTLVVNTNPVSTDRLGDLGSEVSRCFGERGMASRLRGTTARIQAAEAGR